MRLVVAVLEPYQLDSVRQALAEVHVTRLSIADAHGYGICHQSMLSQQVVIEVAVNDDFVDRTLSTIRAALVTEHALGSDRLYTLPMTDAVQIYREVRGPEAI